MLWVGLAGSFVFVLAGTWMLISRVWSLSFTQTLEVAVAAPFLALWVLSPIVWAARPRAEAPESRHDTVISFLAALLLVGIGAYAYIAEFVVRLMVFDIDLQVSSLLLVLKVPALQWAVLGIAGGLRWWRAR